MVEKTKTAFVEYVRDGGVSLPFTEQQLVRLLAEYNEIIGLGGWGGPGATIRHSTREMLAARKAVTRLGASGVLVELPFAPRSLA